MLFPILTTVLAGCLSPNEPSATDITPTSETNPVVTPVKPDKNTRCPSAPVNQEALNKIISALANSDNAGKFRLWKKGYSSDDPNSIGFVFDRAEVTYTSFYYDGRLDVYEHHDKNHVHAYSDHGADGCVNRGIEFDHAAQTQNDDMIWTQNASNQGLKYHRRWQVQYDSFLMSLADQLGVDY